MLDRFITDAYAKPWLTAFARYGPNVLRTKIAGRLELGIPMTRVECLWIASFLEHTRNILGFTPLLTYQKLDPCFSIAAAHRATKTRANLLLYSPYAWEAFTTKYTHDPRKILFQYHPHPTTEQRVLQNDHAQFPEIADSSSIGPQKEMIADREAAWKYADLIFCASNFTKRSLLEVGADESKCRVIPYGVDLNIVAAGCMPRNYFRVLFVGSGCRRKGLHHLLLAWQRASLPEASKLTLVCRSIDKELQPLLAKTPRVEVISGASQERLEWIYSESSLFVMPSLVEGFGQVYLEALSHSCPVLGTANTALPDLGTEKDGIFLVKPGNIDELISKLEKLCAELNDNTELRIASLKCAERFTWSAFRRSIVQALRTN